MIEAAIAARDDSTRERSPVWARLWQRVPQSPRLVAVIVLLVYGICLVAFFRAGNDARDFIYIGSNFVKQSSASQVIRIDPSYHYIPNGVGYDGQFVYYIALDPGNAPSYIDYAGYRYQRILYPIAARLLAFGQPGLIPYTMLLINWLALGGGTLAIAAWLKRKGYSPYFALLYGFSAAIFTAFMRDLTEPLGYGLVAAAIYLWSYGGRQRVLWAGLVFGLAALARETGIIFSAVYGLSLLLEGGLPGAMATWRERIVARWRPVALFFALACGPLVLYKLFLVLWLHSYGVNPTLTPQVVPLAGLLSYQPWGFDQYLQVLIVVVPGIVCALAALWAIRQRIWPAEVWSLLLNIELLIFMLPPPDFADVFASPRLSLGVILAALFCIPALDRALRNNRLWLAIAGTCWVMAVPLLSFRLPGVGY